MPWTSRTTAKLTATAYGTRAELAGVVRRDDVDARRIAFDGPISHARERTGVGGACHRRRRLRSSGRLRRAHRVAPWACGRLFARARTTRATSDRRANPASSGSAISTRRATSRGAAGFSALPRAPRPLGGQGARSRSSQEFPCAQARRGGRLSSERHARGWDRRFEARVERSTPAPGSISTRASGGGSRLGRAPRRRAQRGDRRSPPAGSQLHRRPAGPRDLAYERWPELVPVVSIWRRLSLARRRSPAGREAAVLEVRSGEIGSGPPRCTTASWRPSPPSRRTWRTKLVFEAQSGGLETQKAKRPARRRHLAPGAPGRLAARVVRLLGDARRVHHPRAGISHYVPSIPSVLFRTDATARNVIRAAGPRGDRPRGRRGTLSADAISRTTSSARRRTSSTQRRRAHGQPRARARRVQRARADCPDEGAALRLELDDRAAPR